MGLHASLAALVNSPRSDFQLAVTTLSIGRSVALISGAGQSGKTLVHEEMPFLTMDADSARLPVEGRHHPNRKIHIEPLRIGRDPPCLAQAKFLRDLLAGIILAVKCLGLHKLLLPQQVTRTPSLRRRALG